MAALGTHNYLFWKLCLCILSLHLLVEADRLPIPDGLISLDSVEGQSLLLSPDTIAVDYWPITIHFVTQKNNAYCGVASMVTVLNSLPIEAPIAEEHDQYTYWTQTNLFNEETDEIITASGISRAGLTLNQVGEILKALGLSVQVYHAETITLEDFRNLTVSNLGQEDNYVIINYNRVTLNEEGSGHISPLAAYNPITDKFLLMDTARYKYPPLWISAGQLFDSMNTYDLVSGHSRGFVMVSADGSPSIVDVKDSGLGFAGLVSLVVIAVFVVGIAVGIGCTIGILYLRKKILNRHGGQIDKVRMLHSLHETEMTEEDAKKFASE